MPTPRHIRYISAIKTIKCNLPDLSPKPVETLAYFEAIDYLSEDPDNALLIIGFQEYCSEAKGNGDEVAVLRGDRGTLDNFLYKTIKSNSPDISSWPILTAKAAILEALELLD